MTVTECNDYGPHAHPKKPGRVPLTKAGNALLRNPPGPFTGPITRADIEEIERQAVERYIDAHPTEGLDVERLARAMDHDGISWPRSWGEADFAWVARQVAARYAALATLDQSGRSDGLREALAGANRNLSMIREHLAKDHPDCPYGVLGILNDADRAALATPASEGDTHV